MAPDPDQQALADRVAACVLELYAVRAEQTDLTMRRALESAASTLRHALGLQARQQTVDYDDNAADEAHSKAMNA